MDRSATISRRHRKIREGLQRDERVNDAPVPHISPRATEIGSDEDPDSLHDDAVAAEVS